LEVKVALFNVIKKIRATTFSNKKSRCSSSAFERNFSCILKVSDKKAFLYQFFVAFVPIRVLGDSLENHCARVVVWHDLSMASWTSIVKFFLFNFFLRVRLWLASKLVEKVSRSFRRQCCQILGEWILGDYRGLVKTALWKVVFNVLLNLLSEKAFSLKGYFLAVKAELLKKVFLRA